MRPVISVRNNNITEVVNLLKIFQTEVILYNNKSSLKMSAGAQIKSPSHSANKSILFLESSGFTKYLTSA